MKNSIMNKLSDEAPDKASEGEGISVGSPINVQDGICPICKEHPRFRMIRFDDGIPSFYYMCVRCGKL